MMYGEHTHTQTLLYEILLAYQIKLWHTVLEAQTLCGRLETVWECEGDHTAPKREKHVHRGGSSGSR